MKVYIWRVAKKTTYSYHSGAGVVVFAETLQAAREAARASGDVKEESEVFTSDPDVVLDLTESTDAGRVFVFPDAGCC